MKLASMVFARRSKSFKIPSSCAYWKWINIIFSSDVYLATGLEMLKTKLRAFSRLNFHHLPLKLYYDHSISMVANLSITH